MDSLLLNILPRNRYIFNGIYLFIYFLIILMRALEVSVLTLFLIPLCFLHTWEFHYHVVSTWSTRW